MPILMHRRGPSIRLTKTTTHDYYKGDKVFILPLDQELSVTTTQELQKPIEELFKHVNEAIIGVSGTLGGSTSAAIARSMLEISNMTGFQIGSKSFHSKAWKGSLPSQISITIKFFRGMTGEWSAYDEVYVPALHLYQLTLAYEDSRGGGYILSPVPSPLDVFTAFASGFVDDVIKSVSRSVGTNAELSNKIKTDGLKESSALKGGTTDKTARSFFTSETWNIGIGYYSGGNQFDAFAELNRYICESSTIKWGTAIEKSRGKPYPATAEVTMTLVSEDFLTSADVQPKER